MFVRNFEPGMVYNEKYFLFHYKYIWLLINYLNHFIGEFKFILRKKVFQTVPAYKFPWSLPSGAKGRNRYLQWAIQLYWKYIEWDLWNSPRFRNYNLCPGVVKSWNQSEGAWKKNRSWTPDFQYFRAQMIKLRYKVQIYVVNRHFNLPMVV